MKSWPGVSSQEGYSGSLCFMTSTTPAGGKGDKAGQSEEIAWLVLPLCTKENVLLGHCWHLIGNSLKWLTISYPVISCDSPFNGTLTDTHFPFTSKITAISPFPSRLFRKVGSVKVSAPGNRTQSPRPNCLSYHCSASICLFASVSSFHPHIGAWPAFLSMLELLSPFVLWCRTQFPWARSPKISTKDILEDAAV